MSFGPTKGEWLFTLKKQIYSVMRFYISVYQEIIYGSDDYLLCKHFSITCSPNKAVGGTVIVWEVFTDCLDNLERGKVQAQDTLLIFGNKKLL